MNKINYFYICVITLAWNALPQDRIFFYKPEQFVTNGLMWKGLTDGNCQGSQTRRFFPFCICSVPSFCSQLIPKPSCTAEVNRTIGLLMDPKSHNSWIKELTLVCNPKVRKNKMRWVMNRSRCPGSMFLSLESHLLNSANKPEKTTLLLGKYACTEQWIVPILQYTTTAFLTTCTPLWQMHPMKLKLSVYWWKSHTNVNAFYNI